MKIGPQIASIEVYLIGFFFSIRSTFKGRNRSNLAMIRDQSSLNPIRIESRMQGDHEELKILLQNCLISSRINQELLKRREYIGFYRRSPAKNTGRLIQWRRWDGHDFMKSVGHNPTSPPFPPVQSSLTCHGESMCRPTINQVTNLSRPFDFINEIGGSH